MIIICLLPSFSAIPFDQWLSHSVSHWINVTFTRHRNFQFVRRNAENISALSRILSKCNISLGCTHWLLFREVQNMFRIIFIKKFIPKHCSYLHPKPGELSHLQSAPLGLQCQFVKGSACTLTVSFMCIFPMKPFMIGCIFIVVFRLNVLSFFQTGAWFHGAGDHIWSLSGTFQIALHLVFQKKAVFFLRLDSLNENITHLFPTYLFYLTDLIPPKLSFSKYMVMQLYEYESLKMSQIVFSRNTFYLVRMCTFCFGLKDTDRNLLTAVMISFSAQVLVFLDPTLVFLRYQCMSVTRSLFNKLTNHQSSTYTVQNLVNCRFNFPIT